MQLTTKKPARIGAALCLMTANLLGATHAMAQDQNPPPAETPEEGEASAAITNIYDEPSEELGKTVLDSSVLYYKESGGRVQAVEPMVSLRHTTETGKVFSAKFVYDALTGATPNGATPYSKAQNFVTPANIEGEEYDDDDDHKGGAQGSTGASGTVVINPITGVAERTYTVPAGQLPVDNAFRDSRFALDLGLITPVGSGTKLSIGANGSKEQDFMSLSGRASIAQELGGGATTLSFGANYEYDKIDPFHGIPTAFSVMSGVSNNKKGTKKVMSLIGGITQVLTPSLLVQLNYSYGSAKGYQTDPYKVTSLVNHTTGAPISYLYEARPDKRTRQSIYGAAKWALGSFVTDLSVRYYKDNWGVNSVTAEIAEHVPIGKKAYIQPHVRYYKQGKADFFNYYLLDNTPLPQFSSADSRLDSFSAITFGASAGVHIQDNIEVYLNADNYRTSKSGTVSTPPGALANYDLFAGANSMSVMMGVKFTF